MISPPLSATLYATNYCQYRCQHCFLTDQKRLNADHMNIDVLHKVLDDLKAHQVFMVALSGGDPTLHPQFTEIIKAIRKRDLLPLLGVNALTYDENILCSLRDNQIRHLQVSLDGLDSSANIRTLGEHKKSIENLMFAGFKVTVAITVTKNNADQCVALAKKLIRLGIEKLKISLWQPTEFGLRSGLRPLDGDGKETLFQDLLAIDSLKDRLVLTDFSQTIDGAIVPIQFAPDRLIIRADGYLTTSEMSEPFAHAQDGDIVVSYIRHREKTARLRRSNLLTRIKQEYGISKIWKEPRQKIQCSGMLFQTNGAPTIIVANDISPQESLFVILHEIGHLVLGDLDKSPRQNIARDIEIKVNLWAVDWLKKYVQPRFHSKIRNLARQDLEKDLFLEIHGNLDANLTRYSESQL